MNKEVFIDIRYEAYKSFFDHEWAKCFLALADSTKLKEPAFDLCTTWRGAANTHTMPWLLTTMVKNSIESKLYNEEPFGKKYVLAVKNKLLDKMNSAIRNMLKKDIQKALDEIYEETRAISQIPTEIINIEEIWQNFLGNSESQFFIIGSQRMCYGALYFGYEDFLTRCVGLAKNNSNYRMPNRKEFDKDFIQVFNKDLFDFCYSDPQINIARITRHALVHNGCKITKELQNIEHPFIISNNEIHIIAEHTNSLFRILKERVLKLIIVAREHPNIILPKSVM